MTSLSWTERHTEIDPSTCRVETADQEFKVSLSYRRPLRREVGRGAEGDRLCKSYVYLLPVTLPKHDPPHPQTVCVSSVSNLRS